jgi:drug/metabolite transporter (DMT)-like permease
MMVILDKRFTIVQWIALILSLVGAIVVQLGGHPTHHHHDIVVKHNVVSSMNLGVSDQVAGLTAVLIMCLTNAFGGVYLEAVLKKSDEDIFLQNFRLSLISLPMSGAAVFSDYETIKKRMDFLIIYYS